MRSALARLALSLASVAFALIAAEGVLRLATDEAFLRASFANVDWLVRDPVYLWINRPGFAGRGALVAGTPLEADIRFDSNGLLGVEKTHEKPPGTFRVLCLGDSGTFGLWFEAASDGGVRARRHGYPGELETILHEQGIGGAEVINAGVVGHSSSHGLRQLTTRLAGFEADVLVIRFGYNDHGRAWNEALAVAEPRVLLLRSLLYGLHDWKLTRLALAASQQWAATGLRGRNAPWVALDAFERNHRRFAEIARERGMRLVFVDYPLRPRDWPGSPQDAQLAWMQGFRNVNGVYSNHAAYQEVLRTVAKDEGVPLLETRDALLRADPPGFGPSDFVHPNESGMRAIARRISESLRELDWLPSERS